MAWPTPTSFLNLHRLEINGYFRPNSDPIFRLRARAPPEERMPPDPIILWCSRVEVYPKWNCRCVFAVSLGTGDPAFARVPAHLAVSPTAALEFVQRRA